jgi:hypothetical protein
VTRGISINKKAHVQELRNRHKATARANGQLSPRRRGEELSSVDEQAGGTTRRFPDLTALPRLDANWRDYVWCEEGEMDVSIYIIIHL